MATVTDSVGSGWFAEAAWFSCMDAYFHTARPTPTATTMMSSREDPIQLRRFMINAFPSVSWRNSRSRAGGEPTRHARACPRGAAYPNDAGLLEWNNPQHPIEPESVNRSGNRFADARRKPVLRDAPMQISVDRTHGLDQRRVLGERREHCG